MTKISVIIPVHNNAGPLSRVLCAAIRAIEPADEIIVVADGAVEEDIKTATDFGVQILPLPQQSGPAVARNRGAALAQGDILFFIDADVLIQDDSLEKIRAIFDQNLNLAAVIGSYDDEPAEKNFLSQYRNLLHHYVHQNSSLQATTFWGACGAIRRDIFLAHSGFDERFFLPSVEDIELGYRLKSANLEIMLDKTLQVKHLKRWDPGTLIKTDIFLRALPWTKLILDQDRLTNDLNINVAGRISSFLVIAGIPLFFMAPRWRVLRMPAILWAILLFWFNRGFYEFLLKIRGPWFMLRAIPWHWLYYLYSGLAFLWVYLTNRSPRIQKVNDQFI